MRYSYSNLPFTVSILIFLGYSPSKIPIANINRICAWRPKMEKAKKGTSFTFLKGARDFPRHPSMPSGKLYNTSPLNVPSLVENTSQNSEYIPLLCYFDGSLPPQVGCFRYEVNGGEGEYMIHYKLTMQEINSFIRSRDSAGGLGK